MPHDELLPITGLCIVAQTSPNGYIMMDRCEDNGKSEADLWKDHLFAKKVKRFLCITRVFPLAGGRLNNVLVDICIQEEKEQIPAGYSKVDLTQDTEEQAINKKQLSVKLVTRAQANDAITDIQFLSKSKRAPHGYSLAGEINCLAVVYKVGAVPRDNPPVLPSIPASQSATSTPYPGALQHDHPQGMYNGVTTAPLAQRQPSRIDPLAGVPFEINSIFKSGESSVDDILNITLKSKDRVLNEFDYPFRVEQQTMDTNENYQSM